MVTPEKNIINPDRVGGEDIATAVPIAALPYSDTGDTTGYIDDYDEACPYAGSTAPDVVYSFTPAVDMCVTIDLCPSLYDTKVFVYENAATPGFPYACNDDADCAVAFRSRIDQLLLTAGNTYYIVVDGYGGGFGVYFIDVFEVDCPTFCEVSCPPDGILEGEPLCGDEYVDAYNGGCNSDPAVFSYVADGDVICGESGTYLFTGLSYRDSDWYEIGMGSAGTLSVTCCADFPLQMLLIQANSGDCIDYIVGPSVVAEPNIETTLSWDVDTGFYWIWVGPSVFSGVPCGSQYVMTVDAGGTTPPTIDCGLSIVPNGGELPLSVSFSATLTNLTPASPPPGIRTIVGQIDITTPNGSTFLNWRRGFSNVLPLSSKVINWGLTIPDFPSSLGNFLFHLATEDVTAPPYNQPPHPPSGSTCISDVVVTTYEACVGDNIDIAIPVGALPFSDTGDTTLCNDDYDEVCPYTGSTSPDVVYSFTPAADMCVTIDLCPSLYDTKVFVYENAWTPGAPYACNDDADCVEAFRSKIEGLLLTGGNTYYIVVDGYGGSAGVYFIDVFEVDCPEPPEPCPCPAGAIAEGEPTCYDDYLDEYNGGINSEPCVFSSANIGDVICGESGTYLFTGASYRDTDWYEIGVGLPGTLSMTCDANFPVAMFIIDALSGDCIEYTILGSTTGAECSATYLEAPVTAGGNYWLFVGPSVFTGVPCGSEYTLTVGFE